MKRTGEQDSLRAVTSSPSPSASSSSSGWVSERGICEWPAQQHHHAAWAPHRPRVESYRDPLNFVPECGWLAHVLWRLSAAVVCTNTYCTQYTLIDRRSGGHRCAATCRRNNRRLATTCGFSHRGAAPRMRFGEKGSGSRRPAYWVHIYKHNIH